jgi:outer membrane immunogenic protein
LAVGFKHSQTSSEKYPFCFHNFALACVLASSSSTFKPKRDFIMKKAILCGAALAALLGSPAPGADLSRSPPVYKAPPPPPAPIYTWTGCYLGGNVGWAQENTRVLLDGVEDFSGSKSGFAGGGQIGCDYQFASNWVIGIQGLFDGTSIDAARVSTLFPEDTFHNKVNWFGTVTGRLGFTVTPTFLIYGKAGWGFYENRLTLNDTATGAELDSAGRTQSGPDAGVGAEWMFAPNWSVSIEWNHIFAQDKTSFFANLGAGETATVRRGLDKVLVGVNWRFGWGSPVHTAY